MEGSEGLGAIFPPMVYVLIVFRALGYPDDHPKVLEAQKHLKDLFIREGDTIRIQPCFSVVWDTGIALHALAEAGLGPDNPDAAKTAKWLLKKECRNASDWAKNCPDVEPSGWFFEFANPHYPDVDDTAMVAMALKRDGERRGGAGGEARRWHGCWRCRTTTGAGRRSTGRATSRCWSMCRSRTTMRFRIHRARTSRGGCWSAWGIAGSRPVIRRCARRWISSRRRRTRMAAGSGGGA